MRAKAGWALATVCAFAAPCLARAQESELLPDAPADQTSRSTQADAASVTVYASAHDVAAAEVAGAEKQRVLGIVPNFFVVYSPHPTPLSSGQKFHLAWRSSIDPINFVGSAFFAGIEQANNSFPGYGNGSTGYAKRFGANFADGTISTFLGGAILPSLFRQDPRYYYQGTGTTGSRVRHAMLSVIICPGDNGKKQFNYSAVLGNFASAGISNLYYPASDRNGAGLTLGNAALGSAYGMFGALMQEFVVPHFTPHLPGRGSKIPRN